MKFFKHILANSLWHNDFVSTKNKSISEGELFSVRGVAIYRWRDVLCGLWPFLIIGPTKNL